jgi:hypothetical protein
MCKIEIFGIFSLRELFRDHYFGGSKMKLFGVGFTLLLSFSYYGCKKQDLTGTQVASVAKDVIKIDLTGRKGTKKVTLLDSNFLGKRQTYSGFYI